MKVGFGVTVLASGIKSAQIDGIGSYTYNLGQEVNIFKDVNISAVSFGVPIAQDIFPGLVDKFYAPRFVPSVALSALTSMEFPGFDKIEERIDIFHATDHLIPRLKKVPVLATVMDVIPLTHPEWIKRRFSKSKAWAWKRSIGWSDHVVTISEYSKSEIVDCLEFNEGDVSVIPLGVSENYFVRIDEIRRKEVLDKNRLPENYFLFVGTLQPRKNIGGIMKAHSLLPEDIRKEYQLVVVGRAGWGCRRELDELLEMEANGHARWLNYLPETEVIALMQGASALVFPSLYEGFGLPVLEAFAARLPVITSNVTALPEVAGDAAVLVDPYDVEEISQGMLRIVEDKDLAQTLIERGLNRAVKRSWSACARETYGLYKNIVG